MRFSRSDPSPPSAPRAQRVLRSSTGRSPGFEAGEIRVARSAFLGSVASHARHRHATATEPLALSHAGIVDRAKFEDNQQLLHQPE